MHIEISLATKFRFKLTFLNFWIKLTQKWYFWTKKNENYHQFLHVQINIDSKFQLQQVWFFNIFQKKVYLRSKSEKNEHHYWILHIQISLSTNFQLKLTIAIFWTKFAKKGSYFQSKTDKIDTTIEFCIFELVFVSNFTLKNFKFLDQTYPRKIFLSKIRKSEHHHWISHIQISLGTKFQLKLTTFLTRFAKKWIFWSKTEKLNTTYFLHNSTYSN